jgi:hypothetical protein
MQAFSFIAKDWRIRQEMICCQADQGEGYWGSLYDESRRNKTLAQADSLTQILQLVHPVRLNGSVAF